MGWWEDDDDGGPGRVAKADAGAPKYCFVTYQYVTFTSAQAMEINADAGILGIRPYVPVGAVDDTGRRVAGGLHAAKRRRVEHDVYDHFGAVDPHERWKKSRALRRIVGAWRIGKVLDTKAAEMPGFEGGPSERGHRLTVNVCVEWWDWRKLRRAYTPFFFRQDATDRGSGGAEDDASSPRIDAVDAAAFARSGPGRRRRRRPACSTGSRRSRRRSRTMATAKGRWRCRTHSTQEEGCRARPHPRQAPRRRHSPSGREARKEALDTLVAYHAPQIGDLARDGIDSLAFRTRHRGLNIGGPWMVTTAGVHRV